MTFSKNVPLILEGNMSKDKSYQLGILAYPQSSSGKSVSCGEEEFLEQMRKKLEKYVG